MPNNKGFRKEIENLSKQYILCHSQEFYDLDEQLKDTKIQNEIKTDILNNLISMRQKKKELLRYAIDHIFIGA